MDIALDVKLTALRSEVEIHTPGSAIPQSPHLGEVASFLRWWYTSFPPGVFTTRRRLEVVL